MALGLGMDMKDLEPVEPSLEREIISKGKVHMKTLTHSPATIMDKKS